MTDDQPELRAGPPWVMEEMIDAQLGLPALIGAGPAVERMRGLIGDAATAGEAIVLCGCGTSEHAARAVAAILQEAVSGSRATAQDAFETSLDPPSGGLLVAVSHEGETAATRDAAAGAAVAGARTVLITARPGDAPGGVEVLSTPLYDRSWCHTVAYTSPILTCALAAGLDVGRARTLIASELAARDRRRVDAAALARCERLLIIGSGVDEITAAELALKIEEAAHLPCTPLGVEKVLHGHLPAADGSTGAVLIRYDPSHAGRRDQRADDTAAAVAVLSMPTARLATPGLASSAEALLAGAGALQLLTLELAMVRGTNPDLIRREEPLYRRVAEAGKAG